MATGDISRVKYALGNDADDGDYTTTLVAAVTGKKIRVVGLVVTVLTTAGVFTLKSASTAILAQHLALGVPLVLMSVPGIGICETVAGEALVASNATGVDSYVNVAYVEVEV
jgi:hypothetical protein